MDQEDVVHTYSEIVLSHKTNEIMLFTATWMDLKIILNEVNQTKTDKYHMILLVCGISKK